MLWSQPPSPRAPQAWRSRAEGAPPVPPLQLACAMPGGGQGAQIHVEGVWGGHCIAAQPSGHCANTLPCLPGELWYPPPGSAAAWNITPELISVG